MIINYRQAVPMVRSYTHITSIQSDGNQYIDTGFKPNSNTRVVMDVEALASSVVGYFGVRTGMSSTAYVFWVIGETEVRSDYGNEQKSFSVPSVLTRVTIDKNKNLCYFGDYLVSNSAAEFSCTNNLLLLTVVSGDEVDDRKMAAKLYSCKIYDNGLLIRDYIPVKDDNGQIGLYDLVNEQFYANAGTGSFTEGT